jgi:UPF0755 protein
VLIRMSFRRSALLVLLLAVLVALAVAAGAWFGYLRFAAAPIAGPAPGPVSWSGATVSVPYRSPARGRRASGPRLRMAAAGAQTGAAGHIKVGEYALVPG